MSKTLPDQGGSSHSSGNGAIVSLGISTAALSNVQSRLVHSGSFHEFFEKILQFSREIKYDFQFY